MSRRSNKSRPAGGTATAAAQRRGAADRAAASELHLLQQLRALGSRFRDGRDAEKALRAALRLALDSFGAGEGCVAVLPPGFARAEIAFSLPREAPWDCDLLGAFIGGEKIDAPPDLMVARLRRRARRWGALCVRSTGGELRWETRRALSLIAETANDVTERIDQERIREVRARIDRKIMEQIRPKDLFYQILHGLRSLTDYDHSASLLMCDDGLQTLEVVAEQIAWRKGKSANIGLRLPLDDALRELLGREAVYRFDRADGVWAESEGRPAVALAELMDYDARERSLPGSGGGSGGSGVSGGSGGGEFGAEAGDAPAAAVLCAPLVSRDGTLGVLKIASGQPGSFGAYEIDLVSRFLPHASIALQNNQRTEILERKMLAAERKHAMADLARGVSHDINNALGAVLPLVEELRDDARGGRLDADVAADDLREIHRSLRVCRRIFGGMLRFARGAARSAGDVHLDQEVDVTLAILKEGMERREIEVAVDVPADLPPVRGVQADVEQVLLNLLGNARDAMPDGGRLSIRAAPRDGMIEVVIEDTGCGIAPEVMTRIKEPFFTTKQTGHGLGLAICRSIVFEMRGTFRLESEPGRGTRVTLALPPAGAAPS